VYVLADSSVCGAQEYGLRKHMGQAQGHVFKRPMRISKDLYPGR